MDLGFNLAQSNRDLKDLTSRQIFGDTSGLLCKNDLIPCHMYMYTRVSHNTHFFELSYALLTSHAFGFHGATKKFSAL